MSDEFIVVSGGTIGYRQKVREEGQAEVFAVAVNEFENVSARSRLSFTWTIVPADFGIGETLLLVQCDSDDLVLHIEETEFETDTVSPVQVHLTDRAALVPANGTIVVGVCLNQTAPRVAPALARSNETANVQGNVIWNFPVPAATRILIEWHGAILLAKGQSIAIDLAAASGTLASCSIAGFFAKPDEERT